jgi:hypothetical protein
MNSLHRWREVDPRMNSDRLQDGSRPAHSMARRRRGHASIGEWVCPAPCWRPRKRAPVEAPGWTLWGVGLAAAMRRALEDREQKGSPVQQSSDSSERDESQDDLETGLFGVGLDSEFGAVGDLILRSRDVPSRLMTSCGEALLVCRIELRNDNTKSFPS